MPHHYQSRELVGTFSDKRPEIGAVRTLPHIRTGSVRLAALSRELAAIDRRIGSGATIGRAMGARYRRSKQNRFSQPVASSPEERASGLDRIVRIVARSAAAANKLGAELIAASILESAHPVEAHQLGIDDKVWPSVRMDQPSAWAYRLLRLHEALALEPGSPKVIVAVLDTGVDLRHPELRARLVQGADFVRLVDPEDDSAPDPDLIGDVSGFDKDPSDEAGHGTHVSGVIGALGIGMQSGAAGRGKVMPVRVLGTQRVDGALVGVGVIPDIDDGIKFAVDQGADVINLSLGISVHGDGVPHRRAVNYARMHNVVVIAASGNDGTDSDIFPAAVPGVLTVGAANELGRVAPFSSWGPMMDVVAPGTAIYSCDKGGGYKFRTGTSHAAPFVSGIAALMIARARREGIEISESAVRRIIRDTADRDDTGRFDQHSGAGLANARDAVRLVGRLVETRARRRSRPDEAAYFEILRESAA